VKDENVMFLVLIFLLLTMFLCALCYSVAHYKGYEHGIDNILEYYKATGEFPSRDWLDEAQDCHYNIDDIERSLEQYKPVLEE